MRATKDEKQQVLDEAKTMEDKIYLGVGNFVRKYNMFCFFLSCSLIARNIQLLLVTTTTITRDKARLVLT